MRTSTGTGLRLHPPYARRLLQLGVGLWLYGLSDVMLVRSRLGNVPWDVLHQGVARRTDLSLGTVTVLTSLAVMLLWIPLRQRPGLGTIANIAVIGVSVDVSLAIIPRVESDPWRVALLVSGIALNAIATAAYIGVQLGPGPRDGLMTGLVRRTGRPVRLVRTAIEVVVVAVGALLGGTLGIGTVAYALLIGPLVQPLLPRLTVGQPGRR